MILKSKILNTIAGDMVRILSDSPDEYDIIGTLMIKLNPDCFAISAIDTSMPYINDHIRDGIKLANKSLKTKKPIFSVYVYLEQEYEDAILYFVNDLDSLKKRFNRAKKLLIS
jgi:hypothetical protein